MIGTFKANIPYNNFLLLIYAIVIRLPSFLFPESSLPAESDATLYKFLLSILSPVGKDFPIIYPFICLVLLYGQALWLNKIINAQKLFARSNYLTGMSFLLITAMFNNGWAYHCKAISTHGMDYWLNRINYSLLFFLFLAVFNRPLGYGTACFF